LNLSTIFQFFVIGINIGSIYGVVALGFNIIYNSTGVLNLAQGEFVMLGGLVMVAMTTWLGIPMPIGFIITVAIVTGVGILFERLAIHPSRNSDIVTLIIITVGVSVLLKGVAMFIWGKDYYFLPFFTSKKYLNFWEVSINTQTLWVMGIILLIVVILSLFFSKHIDGKAMLACQEDKEAGWLMGINVDRMILASFALSACIGGIAGIVITPIVLMDYERGTELAIKGFAAAVIGGMGSGGGALLGGLLLGILESLSAGMISSQYKNVIALSIFLIVLLVRPTGILGHPEIEKV